MFDYSRNMEHKDATFALAALGHATRLSIYRLLVRAGHAGKLAGDIAQALSLPGATLSFHLKELAAAGLISAEPKGRTICYRAEFVAMDALLAYLTENCCEGDGSCDRPGSC
jgi:ArsR family transcriptional regulator